MRFIDEATIEVAAGHGGSGCVSFLRMRFQPKGGPDGGDGGRGGHVILKADPNVATLSDHSYLRHFRAGRGEHGQGSNKTGASGEDKIILVPIGTQAYDVQTGQLIADLIDPEQEIILAEGGRGGKGNRHFASSTHQTPRFAQPGEEGQARIVRLSLKLLADVGLIGLPNAGKSSLIRALTAATPKVGNYPFTTLSPNLGVLEFPDGKRLTIADIPGLVEGAHLGAGLGLRFLKHIERTRLFVYVIDLSTDNPISDLDVVKHELLAYDLQLADRPALVAGNKIDLPQAKKELKEFKKYIKQQNLSFVEISAQTGKGVNILIEKLEEYSLKTKYEP